MIVWDIETQPQPEEAIIVQFGEDAVKLGNLKDPEKIAAKKRAAWQKFLEDAALNALTGEVAAIGWKSSQETVLETRLDYDEAELLSKWWDRTLSHAWLPKKLVGFNIFDFDLPFLVQRSLLLGVEVPDAFILGRWWPSNCVDLLEVWRCRKKQTYVGIGALDRALGGEGKTGSGADFARLLYEDRDAAVAYLENDLAITERVARQFLQHRNL